ncbi:hypothetical protein QOZ80_4AG0316260 [Eleusine coracana subsp. coracana]|nr:hypothetical protein QOZ80_4AG0316260 [Eleusine coracana subsp. coracana]
MFLTPRNEEPPEEDIQELISRPNCEPSTTPSTDMESCRDGGRSVSTSRTSTSKQLRVHTDQDEKEPSRGSDGFWAKCFSVPFLLLLGVTASLVVLPLVLPPLPPPPSMLMLVPVAMLLVLLALAFMPTSGGHSGTDPTYL